MKDPLRAPIGASISEFGPAFFFLVVCMFFPLLNLAALCLTYSSCAGLNDLQTKEAALLPRSRATNQSDIVKTSLVQAWRNHGIGAFVRLLDEPKTDVSYENVGGSWYVSVNTTFSAAPLLTVPFLPGIAGVSAPLTFTVSSRRNLEDPANVEK